MTVFENIAFGLRVRKVPAAQIAERVWRRRRPCTSSRCSQAAPACSGGESQRVALARTIVTNPAVFLMDEPLSSLDAKLRVDMRTELKRLHERLKATFIYVTHDQAEAMTMADRIVVMSKGRIEQLGTPLEIYNRPATQFVAGFFGMPTMNFLEGVVENGPAGPRFRGVGPRQPLPGVPLRQSQRTQCCPRRTFGACRHRCPRLRPPASPVCCSRSATRRSCISMPERANRWSRKLRPARALAWLAAEVPLPAGALPSVRCSERPATDLTFESCWTPSMLFPELWRRCDDARPATGLCKYAGQDRSGDCHIECPSGCKAQRPCGRRREP